MTMKEIYAQEFEKHLEAGDDPDTARLRIIEDGCPIPLAELIDKEFGVD